MMSPMGDEIKEHTYESIESPESLPYQSNHAAKALQNEFLKIPQNTFNMDISAMLDNGIITMRENHPTDEHFTQSGKLMGFV